jgi:hypothetical protein
MPPTGAARADTCHAKDPKRSAGRSTKQPRTPHINAVPITTTTPDSKAVTTARSRRSPLPANSRGAVTTCCATSTPISSTRCTDHCPNRQRRMAPPTTTSGSPAVSSCHRRARQRPRWTPSNTDATALPTNGGHPITIVVADDTTFVEHLGNAGRPHPAPSRTTTSHNRSPHQRSQTSRDNTALTRAPHTGNAGLRTRPDRRGPGACNLVPAPIAALKSDASAYPVLASGMRRSIPAIRRRYGRCRSGRVSRPRRR